MGCNFRIRYDLPIGRLGKSWHLNIPPNPHARSGLPWWLSSKEATCQCKICTSIPGSGRSPAEGNGNPWQYSYLGNPMDRGAWWATFHRISKSWTRLSDQTTTRSGLEFPERTGARMVTFWKRELVGFPWNGVCIVNRLLSGVMVTGAGAVRQTQIWKGSSFFMWAIMVLNAHHPCF